MPIVLATAPVPWITPAKSALPVMQPRTMSDAMSPTQLSELCFSSELLKTKSLDLRASEALADLPSCSEDFVSQVTKRTASREGSLHQRYDIHGDPEDRNVVVRVTTGTVPILTDGRLMLVSSQKKPEWGFPKGGWESDEAMHESAIRETFEEAGVTGILGPPLSAVTFETRKARKRRLLCGGLHSESQTLTESSSNRVLLQSPRIHESIISPKKEEHGGNTERKHTHVRMTLFPLFVQKVHDSWPESGRLRRVASLEEAEELLCSKPEFLAALRQLRHQGMA